MTNKKLFYGIFFLSILYLGGCLSIFFGRELCWDLANYHYYNPYYFLNHRESLDFWPKSFIHLYINPTLDLFSYFLINHFSPMITVFTLGAIHSINFILLFLIALQIGSRNILLAILLAGLGMYGPVALSGIGSFQNDNLVSIFVLAAVLLQLKVLQKNCHASESWHPVKIEAHWMPAAVYPCMLSAGAGMTEFFFAAPAIIFAGIFLGLAVGFKLTSALYVIGSIVAWVFVPINISTRVRYIILLCVVTIFGMLLSSGYWLWLMWIKHHNPFFPFYNAIFHSPDFPAINWKDARFLPQTILEKLFYPFYFSWDGRVSDIPFRDFRFLIVYILFVIAGLACMLRKIKNVKPEITWLVIFFIFSYVFWQFNFSIMRYLVALEMLTPLIIFLLIKLIIKNIKMRFIILTSIFLLLIFTMEKTPSVRALWFNQHFFNTQLPAEATAKEPGMVLIAYSAYTLFTDKKPSKQDELLFVHPRPQNYLIPFFPANWRFIGIPFAYGKITLDSKDENKIRSLINSYSGKIYLLTAERDMPDFYKEVKQFGLAPAGNCEQIKSDRQIATHDEVWMCGVERLTITTLIPE